MLDVCAMRHATELQSEVGLLMSLQNANIKDKNTSMPISIQTTSSGSLVLSKTG